MKLEINHTPCMLYKSHREYSCIPAEYLFRRSRDLGTVGTQLAAALESAEKIEAINLNSSRSNGLDAEREPHRHVRAAHASNSEPEHTAEEIYSFLKDLIDLDVSPRRSSRESSKQEWNQLLWYFSSFATASISIRWNKTKFGRVIWELHQRIKQLYVADYDPEYDDEEDCNRVLGRFNAWKKPSSKDQADEAENASSNNEGGSESNAAEGASIESRSFRPDSTMTIGRESFEAPRDANSGVSGETLGHS
jgi:hypothetical protein